MSSSDIPNDTLRVLWVPSTMMRQLTTDRTLGYVWPGTGEPGVDVQDAFQTRFTSETLCKKRLRTLCNAESGKEAKRQKNGRCAGVGVLRLPVSAGLAVYAQSRSLAVEADGRE